MTSLGFIVYIHAVCCSLSALIVGYSVPCVQNAFKKACSQQEQQVVDVWRDFLLVKRTSSLQISCFIGRDVTMLQVGLITMEASSRY